MPMSLSVAVLALLMATGAVEPGDTPAVATPSAASTPSASPPSQARTGLNDPNRLICKREHVVGSNRPQKICMTAAERQRLKDKADDLLDPTRSTPGEADALRSSQGGIGG